MDTEITTDVMTADQMRALMRADQARIIEAAREVDEQLRIRADTLTSNRFGGPGGAGAEEIKAALLATQEPKLAAAERQAAGAARAAEANAFAIRSQLGQDRITLPAGDLVAAGARMPIVKHQTETLSLPKLAAEIRAAVAGGDLVSQYLYAVVAPQRLANAGDAQAQHPDTIAARSEIVRLLSRIRADLRDTTMDPIRAETDRVLERAETLRGKASKRQKASPKLETWDGRTKVPWPVRVS